MKERCSEARVILNVPWSLSDFGNHHVSITLGHLIGYFLVFLIDDDGSMGKIRLGEFLISDDFRARYSVTSI